MGMGWRDCYQGEWVFTTNGELFTTNGELLSSLRPVTVKVQKRSSDILKAYAQLSNVQLDLDLLKLDCDEEFHIWLEEIVKFAKTLASSPGSPIVWGRREESLVHTDCACSIFP